MFQRVELLLVWSLYCCGALTLNGTSTEPDSLRLVGGDGRCRGELQVQRSGQNWTGVFPVVVPLRFGNRVCAELGCGSALTAEKKRVSNREVLDLSPDNCEDTSLMRCFRSETHRSDCNLELNCSDSVRLVGGRSLCSGSLQIRDQTLNQSWAGVCEGALGGRGAEVLCRELGCGAPLLQGALSPLGQMFHCEGNESALMDCPRNQTRTQPGTCSTLRLTCSEPLRLVGGDSRCEGTVEVKYRGEWRRVVTPYGHWDLEAVAAVCRSLDCGSAVSTKIRGVYPKSAVWFIRADCVKDTAVRDCVFGGYSDSVYGQELMCSGPLAVNGDSPERGMLKLVGGANRCEGTAELKHKGEWRRVRSADPWDLEAAAAVCRVLDCGSAVSTGQRGGFNRSDVWHISSDCVKTKAAVRACVTDGFSGSDSGLELVCSDSVRLVGGRSLCSGSLQIQDQSSNQSWAGVCEGALGGRGAEVLCRELGCGAPLLQGALSPLGQTFHCEGHESALMDCPRNQSMTRPGTCSTLRLTCSEPLRLVGGASRCEGLMELKYRGEWRLVKSYGPEDSYDPWDLGATATVCRDLDCGSAVSTEQKGGYDISDVWSVKSVCVKKSSVRGCAFASFSYSDAGLEVVCSDSVRLVGGQSLCSGSLQIRDQSLDKSWAGVCEGALGRRGAEVLCRELGCGAPLLQGELSPLGQMFHCEGHESALMDCPRNQSRTHPGTCTTLRLTCSEPLRLVGGPSRCEGTVEMKYKGEWRRMAAYFKPYVRQDPWDLRAAAVVCRDLDCGSAVSTERRGGFTRSNVWGVDSDCVKTNAAVRHCVWGGISAGDDGGLWVLCSGYQEAPEDTESLPLKTTQTLFSP